jgi:hypothetical protein
MRRITLFAVVALFMSVSAWAQAVPPARATPVPTPASAAVAGQAPTPPAAARPTASSSWQNVKLEFTITDTFGNSPSKKTVSMLVVDRGTGRIRSSMQVKVPMEALSAGMTVVGSYSFTTIVINIDATVTLPSSRGVDLAARGLAPATFGANGQVMLNLTVQYTPDTSVQPVAGAKAASLDESLNLVVWDGKPTLVSQSADPQGDRKVTLEVTATVIR